jgi:hypothetical protein
VSVFTAIAVKSYKTCEILLEHYGASLSLLLSHQVYQFVEIYSCTSFPPSYIQSKPGQLFSVRIFLQINK